MGASARAAEAGRAFAVPVQPLEDALLALGRQAGVSVGFAPDAHCGGQAGVRGRMSLDAALARLLADSACEAARPDARTVVIRARRRPAAKPAAAEPLPGAASLSEIVVTAEKRETLLSSSASGLSAVAGQELARRDVTDAQDLSLLAAGVTVTNLGPGRDKVLLRGISDGPLTGHTQSTVGLYLGELRLTYNAPDPDLPFLDLSRLEVLRGPQGSLYGSGSIGGVLHLVPNAPEPARRSGRIAASVSHTRHGAGSYDGDLILNQPLLNARGAVRVVAWYEVEGGAIDDVAREVRDVDRTRRAGLRLSGLYQASRDLDLEATLIQQNIDTRDAHYAEPAEGPLARTSAYAEPHDNDFLALSLTARWSPAWGRVTATLGALDHDVVSTYDASAAPSSLLPPDAQPATFKDENEIRGVLAELRASSVGAGPLQWVAGAFGSFGRQRLDAAVTTTTGAAGYVEERRDRLVETALFGEISYDVRPDLTVTVGGRGFLSALEASSNVAIGAPVRAFEGRARNSGFAPMARLAWRPARGVTAYLLAAEGYRTAGFNTGGPTDQVFGATPGDTQPLRRYGADELTNYEAGLRWRSPAGHATLRVAAFQADWREIQADLLLESGLAFTANLGDGRSRGFEAEASYRAGGLFLAGNLTAQDAELRHPALGLDDRSDTKLPGVARLSWAVSVAYERTLPTAFTLALNGDYASVGSSRLTFDSLAAPRMGDFGGLRLGAALRRDDWSLSLSVQNALDSRGDTLAFGNPFTFRTTAQSTPQRPRTVRLAMAKTF